MKHSNKTFLLGLSALSLVTSLNIQTAQASSAFTGVAGVNISVTNISNQSNPDNSYGNDILFSGSSELDPASGSFINGLSNISPVFLGTPLPLESNAQVLPSDYSFAQSMQILGTATNGDIASYYFGETLLSLENTSLDDYLIEYSLSYNLHVGLTGEYAEGTASITGDNIGLPDDGFGGYIEVGNESDTFSENNTLQLSLLVEAGSIAEFYSAFEFSGYAQATAPTTPAPVPLPGAVWLFLAGVFSLSRFKRH